MEIKECYQNLGGDYDAAIERFGSDSLIDRFMHRFTEDKTIETLRAAVAADQITESFQAAHTLKGVAGNLSFMELFQNASNLTEQLRPQESVADPELVAAVEASYKKVMDTIAAYDEGK